jgi:hypothetical protein
MTEKIKIMFMIIFKKSKKKVKQSLYTSWRSLGGEEV